MPAWFSSHQAGILFLALDRPPLRAILTPMSERKAYANQSRPYRYCPDKHNRYLMENPHPRRFHHGFRVSI